MSARKVVFRGFVSVVFPALLCTSPWETVGAAQPALTRSHLRSYEVFRTNEPASHALAQIWIARANSDSGYGIGFLQVRGDNKGAILCDDGVKEVLEDGTAKLIGLECEREVVYHGQTVTERLVLLTTPADEAPTCELADGVSCDLLGYDVFINYEIKLFCTNNPNLQYPHCASAGNDVKPPVVRLGDEDSSSETVKPFAPPDEGSGTGGARRGGG